jgi:His/Glu/Gln/Arg/opine family amino acid ABC transporter permease subunit
MYEPDFRAVFERLDLLAAGLLMTFALAIASMLAATVIGLLLAVGQMSKVRVIRSLSHGYVQLFRGVPLYVYIFWLYYSFGSATGILLSPVEAGVICLATLYGAYLAEIDRGALMSIPRQQHEAAAALGLTPVQSFRDVVLPQAIRTIIPPSTNMFAGVVMDTALVSSIGVVELMRVARIGSSESFRPFEFYTVAALIYIVVVLLISLASAYLERRLTPGASSPGFGRIRRLIPSRHPGT